MEKKKNFTIEELAKQYEDAKKTCETIGEQLNKAKQEEAERKKAQLTLEKEARKKEVDEAGEKYLQLLRAYIKDYGAYSKESDFISTNLMDEIFNNKPWWCF